MVQSLVDSLYLFEELFYGRRRDRINKQAWPVRLQFLRGYTAPPRMEDDRKAFHVRV